MNQLSLTMPTLSIKYNPDLNFKFVIRMQRQDGSLYDITSLTPTMEIYSKDGLIMTISGIDVEKTQNSELVFKKAKSFFSTLDCMENYTYKIIDQPTDQGILNGPFKIVP